MQKYGQEVADNVYRFYEASGDVRALKAAERSGMVAAGDTALWAGQAVTGIGAAALSVAALAQDTALGAVESGVNKLAGKDLLHLQKATPIPVTACPAQRAVSPAATIPDRSAAFRARTSPEAS